MGSGKPPFPTPHMAWGGSRPGIPQPRPGPGDLAGEGRSPPQLCQPTRGSQGVEATSIGGRKWVGRGRVWGEVRRDVGALLGLGRMGGHWGLNNQLVKVLVVSYPYHISTC